MSAFENSPTFAPYSKVILWYDDENAFTAGDDTGRTLEADCPWATQAMADAMLANVQGYAYSPFTATDAMLDPAAELGDGVTANGVYGPLAAIDTSFDAMCAADAAAPADKEIDHEYPYQSHSQRELARKVTLGASYFGTRITRRNGLEIVKTDGETEKSRVVLNSDLMAFYNDDGTEALYFDANAGKFRFAGDVAITGGTMNINNNFVVDAQGNLSINGNINLSGGTITWGGNKPSSGISESRCKTIINEELVSSPNIAGGKFWDLNQSAYIEMGTEAAGMGNFIGYMNLLVGSDTTPVFTAYCRKNSNSNSYGVALRAAGNDFLSVDAKYDTVTPMMTWDFSYADVPAINGDDNMDITAKYDLSLEATRGDLIMSCPDGDIRIAASSGQVRIYVDGTVWYLDADGWHT